MKLVQCLVILWRKYVLRFRLKNLKPIFVTELPVKRLKQKGKYIICSACRLFANPNILNSTSLFPIRSKFAFCWAVMVWLTWPWQKTSWNRRGWLFPERHHNASLLIVYLRYQLNLHIRCALFKISVQVLSSERFFNREHEIQCFIHLKTTLVKFGHQRLVRIRCTFIAPDGTLLQRKVPLQWLYHHLSLF